MNYETMASIEDLLAGMSVEAVRAFISLGLRLAKDDPAGDGGAALIAHLEELYPVGLQCFLA